MADFATQSGHWYGPDGSPAYTVVGKNGAERPTTIRDARERGLLPSVTTIIRTASQPAVERWKRNQVLLAALTLPRAADEAEQAWLARVEKDWQEQGSKAAERGSRIHGAIEKHFRNEPPDMELWPQVCAARDQLAFWCRDQMWLPERSFAHPYGYGGKVDLHSREWVVDVKTKEFSKGKEPDIYDDHAMQLAAYRQGLQASNAQCAILFVSASEPGLALFRPLAETEIQRGLTMFMALFTYWKAANKYNPAIEKAAA